jgi:hypothetical protein
MNKYHLNKVKKFIIENKYYLATILVLIFMSLILYWLGRNPIYEGGFIKFYHTEAADTQTSQHFLDPYSFSHLLHGLLFYAIIRMVFRIKRFDIIFLLAVIFEAMWEIGENTEFIINRYRDTTVSFDYYGDSIINSLGDVIIIIPGLIMAKILPVWLNILIFIVVELTLLFTIKDNLTLNILMLIYPIEAIRTWQLGG